VSDKLSCFYRVSPYFKAALASNIIGIVGLAYLLAELTFPELFVSEEELSSHISSDMFSGIYGFIYLVGLSASVSLLVITAISGQNQKLLALASLSIGVIVSLSVILGIFFN
jgi:hypothetical protein